MLSSHDPYLDNLKKLNSKQGDGTSPGLLELGDQVRDVGFGNEDPSQPLLRVCLYMLVIQVSVLWWVKGVGVRDVSECYKVYSCLSFHSLLGIVFDTKCGMFALG